MPPRPNVALDVDVRTAILASNLGELAPDTIAQLTVEARRVSVPAGSTIHRVGESWPHLEIVVTGLVRVFVIAHDGRTLTVRYCRPTSSTWHPTASEDPISSPGSANKKGRCRRDGGARLSYGFCVTCARKAWYAPDATGSPFAIRSVFSARHSRPIDRLRVCGLRNKGS